MTTNDPHLDALEPDLEAAFAVPVPELRLEDALAGRAGRFATPHRGAWRVTAAAAVAAGLIAAVAFLPGYLGGGTKTVSAKELIERSAAVTAALHSSPANYRMVAVSRSSGSEVTTESWYGGLDRFRNESRSIVTGGQSTLEGTARVGDEFWMYQDHGAGLRVAHGRPHFSIVDVTTPTLADHLGAWTQDDCFAASITGKEELGGRQANVIFVVATPQSCKHQPKPLKRATLWLDAETDMALRMVYEADTPDASTSYEVTLFETFTELPDSAFIYTAPPGADVIEFTTQAELKDFFVVVVPRGSHVVIENDWRVELTPVAANETPGP